MKTLYVLFVIITDQQSGLVTNVAMQEFENQKACFSAERFVDFNKDDNLDIQCHPKYIKAEPWER